jgi:hypothetical protein
MNRETPTINQAQSLETETLIAVVQLLYQDEMAATMEDK